MTNYNRSGAGAPEAFSKQFEAAGGCLLRLASVTKGRGEWTAEIVVCKNRVLGTLKRGDEVVRPFFKVSLDYTNRFTVDIGTGSGVRIAFQTESNQR